MDLIRSTPGSGARRRRGVRVGPKVVSPRLAVTLAVAAVTLAACSSSPKNSSSTTSSTTTPSAPAPGGASSPGVTSNSVTVGQVDDLSAPLPGLFKGAQDGTQAYIAYINSLGGVNGRMLKLDSRDSAFQGGLVASETASQVQNDFALVGGFSLLDSSEKPLIDTFHMPDLGFSLDPTLASDPYVYSPIPNPVNNYPLGLFKWLKQRYPQAVKKVGIIWENATASTQAAEHALESAMKAEGFQIVYDRGAGPFETNFLSDIISMQNAGVQMFFAQQLTDSYAAKLAQEMQQQNFKPVHIEGAAYSNQLLSLAGSAANGVYIEQGYALYLGQDANVVPAVKLFDKWMKKVDANANFEIESVYGWASAQLFAQALKDAGNPPTRAGLLQALNKITTFDAGGLIPPSNPAAAILSGCFLLAQVQNGQIKRVPPTPATGFYCGQNGYNPAPGYQPVVRPTS